jgi:hypothetical protein
VADPIRLVSTPVDAAQLDDLASGDVAQSIDALVELALEERVLLAPDLVHVAYCRRLARLVDALTFGTSPTVAEVHLVREVRFALAELRALVEARAHAAARR